MRALPCLLCCTLLAACDRVAEPKPPANHATPEKPAAGAPTPSQPIASQPVVAEQPTAAAPGEWVTIKGTVVFPEGKPIPKQAPLNVPNINQMACLNGKAPLDESIIVNAKNRGIKNVVVYLRPDSTDPKAKFAPNQIYPADVKRKPSDVVIDQPCCMFIPRVATGRVGDRLVVKNSAAFAHNFLWVSQNNGESNQNIQPNGQWKMANPLVAETSAIPYKCTIHGWMSGFMRIFEHPYYAVTDENGKFEIKNAPAGKFRIVYWHENGLRGGGQGRFGDPIDIKGPTLEMKPTDFDVSPK